MIVQELKTLIDNGQGGKAPEGPAQYKISSGICQSEFEAKKRFKQDLAQQEALSRPGKVLWTDYPMLERNDGKYRITARFSVRTTD